jgi:hypothetical protein
MMNGRCHPRLHACEDIMETSTTLPAAASALGISFDGRAYHYQQFSYDRYADALGYAGARPRLRHADTGPASRTAGGAGP